MTQLNNLTINQRKALKELKADVYNEIYPYDKRAGLVRIKRPDAIAKIKEQNDNTEVITKDPIPTLARKFQATLRNLHKQRKFTDAEQKKLYLSDPIPPRMYEVIKAHKPKKELPNENRSRYIVTPSYRTSEYLVKIIQPLFNRNETRLKNSSTFVDLSKT